MIAAVDLGSTNFKAALFDSAGNRVGQASEPLPYSLHTEDRAELDPEVVKATFFKLLLRLVESGDFKLNSIRRVALTSQANTFVVTSAEGVPLSPFYGWSDGRAEEAARVLQERLGANFHRCTGWPRVTPRLMLSKVLWWQECHSRDSSSRFVSLPAYLGMALGAEHCNDANLAAMSGFYSLVDGCWWDEALSATNIEPSQLGGIVPTGCPLAMQRSRVPTGFHPDLEVVPVGNDHTAGAVSCGCRKGEPILTLGTTGVVYRSAGMTAGPFSGDGLWGPYPSGGYYELQCLNHACSALDWANEALLGSVDSKTFVSLAREASVDESTPFFYPLEWGTEVAWQGEDGSGANAGKAYAAFEGILFALRAMVGPAFYQQQQPLRVLGGGSRIDFWLQLAADCFQRPICRSRSDGLAGAAMIAGQSVCEEGAAAEPIFQPDQHRQALLDQRFTLWRSLDPSHSDPK